MSTAKLYYVHDPMCSWCWAYRPIVAQIKSALLCQVKTQQIDIVSVLGGLAADSDELMDPQTKAMVQGHWQRIENEVGSEFNHDFWAVCEPRRSTYPACRAVIAARAQGADESMILAIQQAYYLRAMNPSDDDTLLQLADEMALDFDVFMRDFQSAAVAQQLLDEVEFAQQLQVQSYPSWRLVLDNKLESVPLDYQSAQLTLASLSGLLRKDSRKD